MAHLPREHGDLPAVMRVVCQKVRQETGDVGFEAIDASVTFQCLNRGLLGTVGAFQLRRNLLLLARTLQPRQTNAVPVSHNRADFAVFSYRRRRATRRLVRCELGTH